MKSDQSLTSARHWWSCDSDKEVRATNISLGGQILPVVRGGGSRASRLVLTSDATEPKSQEVINIAHSPHGTRGQGT